MIVVRLNGGLGNQMFQYALGRRLSLERGRPLWLDLTSFEKQTGSHSRDYALGAFCIHASRLVTKARLPLWDRVAFHRSRLGFTREKADHALQALPPGNWLYLSGFWQREEYFGSIADKIREELQLKTSFTPARQKIATAFDDRCISVHVRRGDYADVPRYAAFFGTCDPAWYEEAINYIHTRVENPRFLVFSDDPDWARANLNFNGHAVQFVDRQADSRDFEDLHLMSRCAHHIIANSSFSWWAAWLNPSSAKIVVAPKLWYRGAPEWPVHVPESWIRL
jgi:hypothetical protein